jgi:hypothetical protein
VPFSPITVSKPSSISSIKSSAFAASAASLICSMVAESSPYRILFIIESLNKICYYLYQMFNGMHHNLTSGELALNIFPEHN